MSTSALLLASHVAYAATVPQASVVSDTLQGAIAPSSAHLIQCYLIQLFLVRGFA